MGTLTSGNSIGLWWLVIKNNSKFLMYQPKKKKELKKKKKTNQELCSFDKLGSKSVSVGLKENQGERERERRINEGFLSNRRFWLWRICCFGACKVILVFSFSFFILLLSIFLHAASIGALEQIHFCFVCLFVIINGWCHSLVYIELSFPHLINCLHIVFGFLLYWICYG